MTNVLDLIAYRDGEYKPLREIGPSILDFGFIHCDATYDVMPVYNGKAFCYDRHSTRFENSAKRYGLELPDVDRLSIVKELKKVNDVTDAFVWFLVWRGTPPSGNPRDIKNCPIHFAMYIKPSYPIADNPIVTLHLDTNTNRVSDDYYGQEYKNMAWLDLTMSQRNKPADADTTILIDVDGNVTEGPGFNVGIVSNGVIYTADKNVLKGITMTVVEDIAKDNGILFARLPISQEQFNNANEVFITSSSGGVTATQKSGPITELLINRYKDKMEEYGTVL
jgi:branched-chain amino acid aminotransferase|tara:strand:- start:3438 stop:4274 length:837 start_codon:yes stop_codon:yes gene_type:complete